MGIRFPSITLLGIRIICIKILKSVRKSIGVRFPSIFIHWNQIPIDFINGNWTPINFLTLFEISIQIIRIPSNVIDGNRITIDFYRLKSNSHRFYLWESNSHQFSYTFQNFNTNYLDSQQCYRWLSNYNRFLSIGIELPSIFLHFSKF